MASIIVHQVGFRKSAALDRHVTEKLGLVLRREQADGRAWSVDVYIRIANRAPDGRAMVYETRVAVKLPARQRPLASAGKGRTARASFADALVRIEKRLRRGARMSQSGRRSEGHSHRTVRAAKRQQT
ncbi:MAG: hypothetical protein QY320_06105 [Gammaproteobacteria bacterium]|nr:MAG: hypothetical protein QY320_06105 [Gammaproteobacteria bacterium]